jgi:DNA-binding transcriptional LysR family regulator
MSAMALDALEIFCNVARTRSFSEGARRSGITQSAASQRVRSLEEELGVQLVDRSTRPLRLTAAGRAYYEGCVRILDRYERLLQGVVGEAHRPRGQLEMAAIYSSDRAFLKEVRERMQACHPGVSVHVTFLHPQEVHDAVRAGRADLGILSYPDRWPDLAALPLRDEEMAVVCHPTHPLAAAERVTPRELESHALVGFNPSLPIARDILAFLRRHGTQPRVTQTFDNIDSIKASLAGPAEAAVLPARTARPEADRGELVAIPLDPVLTRPLAVVHRRDREFSPALEALVGCLLGQDGANAPEVAIPCTKGTAA